MHIEFPRLEIQYVCVNNKEFCNNCLIDYDFDDIYHLYQSEVQIMRGLNHCR